MLKINNNKLQKTELENVDEYQYLFNIHMGMGMIIPDLKNLGKNFFLKRFILTSDFTIEALYISRSYGFLTSKKYSFTFINFKEYNDETYAIIKVDKL